MGYEGVPVKDEDSKEYVEEEDEHSNSSLNMQGKRLMRYSKFDCGVMGGSRTSLFRWL